MTALGQSGSYLDGGCSHHTQLAAIPLLEPQAVQQDKEALQQLFLKKRNHVLDRLEKMGLTVRVLACRAQSPFQSTQIQD